MSRVIAIDGPAASGKSSTAASVAQRLGWVHVDSGALYRALTWVAVTRHLDRTEPIIAAADALHVALRARGLVLSVVIDGVDDDEVDAAIRSPEVNARVSAIAAFPALRDWVNRQLRDAVTTLPGAVVDGRDIGTVVFPDAALKIYLTASPAARAERRLRQRGETVDAGDLAAETARLAERDRLDSTRSAAPLRPASDAVALDTTALAFEEQVERIVALARERGIGAEQR